MRLKARIWTPEPSSNEGNWIVEVDLEEVIGNTELPIPVLIEFDQEREVGKVVELSIKDGCLEGVLDLTEPVGKVLTRFSEEHRADVRPAIGWITTTDLSLQKKGEPMVFTAEKTFAVALSSRPAVPGTYIEDDQES